MTVTIGEATFVVRLSTLDEHEAMLVSQDYDVISRTGVRGIVRVDRKTWELLGRPVTLATCLETREWDEADLAASTLAEVGRALLERQSDGHTPDEDDADGLLQILSEMGGGPGGPVPDYPPSRGPAPAGCRRAPRRSPVA